MSNDLLKSLTLIEYLGDGSKKQGEFNGPDFIFKDNNKTIGIELTYGVKNLIFDPKITDDKK
ncbi:MAG: hypothetical protein MJ219_00380 [Mycoplasmoidaceae bacterium]|nr:hypothetical protein [Mycoplasmoidaceae bacterium]